MFFHCYNRMYLPKKTKVLQPISWHIDANEVTQKTLILWIIHGNNNLMQILKWHGW